MSNGPDTTAPDYDPEKTVKVYLSQSEFAARVGVAPRSLSRIKLPLEDVRVGPYRGWSEETIDAWDEQRPGRGRWGSRGLLVD